MDIIFLGVVCIGLGLYVLWLQHKVGMAQRLFEHMLEAMYDVADGNAKFVRTDKGVKCIFKEDNDDKLLS